MRRSLAVALVALAAGAGGVVAANELTDEAAAPPESIKRSDLRNNDTLYSTIDQARAGQDFNITINGQPRAVLGPYSAPDPPPTTTTPPPTTTTPPPVSGSYPSVEGTSKNFETGNFSQFGTVYEESTTWTVPSGGAGEGNRWGKTTDSRSSGQRRGELAVGNFAPGSEVEYEVLFYVPSGVNHVGYLAQHKQDETDGSCANGGLSAPREEPNRLLLRVRSDCDADHRDLDLGPLPKDRWFAVWVNLKSANSGGFAHARLDPDGPGPNPYGQTLSVTGDTSSGGTLKLRVGSYGEANGAYLGVDGYRLSSG